ncbi:hypothetical protein [Paractinoplanes atraurantiacus]|uniref:hypothetical protein n=1 Tax=Paractinoplanes atraurantiacus TaxID=1036182 RepID=UPI001FE9D9F4|nr:hypothetical protein [Actinoplanes atraurantiacus]
MNPEVLKRNTQAVADRATCRTVDAAIVAYAGVNGASPASIAEVADYVKGDISAYRIVKGQAAGPGC